MDNKYGLDALTRILEDCTGKKYHMEAVQVRLSGLTASKTCSNSGFAGKHCDNRYTVLP